MLYIMLLFFFFGGVGHPGIGTKGVQYATNGITVTVTGVTKGKYLVLYSVPANVQKRHATKIGAKSVQSAINIQPRCFEQVI